MKKFAFILTTTGLLTLSLISCQDKGSGDTDVTDTVSTSTMPAETPPPHTETDTVAVPPVDPAMDTSKEQTPKM